MSNGESQPSQFWVSRTRTLDPLEKLCMLRNTDLKSRRWETGSRRARLLSNVPSIALFERRRSSRESKNRETCTCEVADAERRLSQVAGGAHRTQSTLCSSPRCVPAPEVGDLQRQIAELLRERDQLHQGVSKKKKHGE